MTGGRPAEPDEALGLDVVCVNYRSAGEVRRLADGLLGLAQHGISHRLFVVDCSGEMADGTEDEVVGAHVLDPGRNIGFGRACNLGLQSVSSDVVALLNPDFAPDPGGFAQMVRSGHEDLAVAWTGVVRNADGSVQRNTAPAFTLWRLALEYLFGIDTSLPAVTAKRPVRTISGAVLMAIASDLRAVGGFDAAYPLYMEDVDLTDRLARRGVVVQYPVEVGVHIGGTSSVHAPRATTTLLHASRIRWFARQGRMRGVLARAIVVGGCSLRWLIRPRLRPGLSPAAIWRAGATAFPLAELLPERSARS